jgi:ribosomal protein L17
VNALFDEAPARYANRRNDYSFIKLQERKRRGDGVELVLLSLVVRARKNGPSLPLCAC